MPYSGCSALRSLNLNFKKKTKKKKKKMKNKRKTSKQSRVTVKFEIKKSKKKKFKRNRIPVARKDWKNNMGLMWSNVCDRHIWDKVFKSGLSKLCGRLWKIDLVHSGILCPIWSYFHLLRYKTITNKILLKWNFCWKIKTKRSFCITLMPCLRELF